MKDCDSMEERQMKFALSGVKWIICPQHMVRQFLQEEKHRHLATVTLGTSREANQIDMPSFEGEETFYLHYNFPPFSTGEARPIRGTSRREIGHGNLAQRALKGMIPEDCPYTVRVVSEVLESNGSSSMATVCSGTMALNGCRGAA